MRKFCLKQLFVLVCIVICSVAKAEEKKGYPEFSWDTVPMFHHAGSWDTSYSEEQLKFIAEKNFSIVVFEKMHGLEELKYPGELENAIFKDARKLKKLNPDTKCIFYLNAFVDNVFTEWRTEYGKSPEWLLRDENGDPIFKIRGDNYIQQFDITKPGMKEWWIYSAKSALAHPAIDGIFIDALVQVVRFPEEKIKKWGRDKYEEMVKATYEVLKETKENLPEDAIIINNGLFSNLPGLKDGGIGWLEIVNGAMVEHFGAFGTRDKDGNIKPEDMAREIELIQKAAEMGKIVIVKGWPGNLNFIYPQYKSWSKEKKIEHSKKHLEFSLAAFLVAAEKYCYFGYSWGWDDRQGWFQWYPEFDKPLGKPKGKAKRNGYVYTREFEHASVRVDLENETAEIDWE